MSTENQPLTFTQFINTEPRQAYRAFTRSLAFRQWLCDSAQADPRPGGRLYLWWLSGYYTCGEFTHLERHKNVTFTWFGKGEPGPTEVRVTFNPQDDGTLVRLVHDGSGSGEEWAETRSQFQKGWDISLENLTSLLETGQDLRFTRRPMLGISIGDFDIGRAKKLGVPITEGICIADVMEGMGAETAGLSPDDVIVNMDGVYTTGWDSLSRVLNAHQAGDEVVVEYYRGNQKHTTKMALSQRPLPDIPSTSEILAVKVRRIYKKVSSELETILDGITPEEATHQPAPAEWSVKETLAHLIITEREWQCWIADLINDDERWSDTFANPTNVPARIRATLSVYPSVPELLQAFCLSQAETLALLAAVPQDLVARKGSYFQVGYTMLESDSHLNMHLEQIRAALLAGRGMNR